MLAIGVLPAWRMSNMIRALHERKLVQALLK